MNNQSPLDFLVSCRRGNNHMRFFLLQPPVAGQFGPNAIVDTSTRPAKVTKYHYEIHHWLGDAFLTTMGTYIGSSELVDALMELNPTGIVFDTVEVTANDIFGLMKSSVDSIGKFYWFKITGLAGEDDFGLNNNWRLVVSERALRVMMKLNIENCGILQYQACPSI